MCLGHVVLLAVLYTCTILVVHGEAWTDALFVLPACGPHINKLMAIVYCNTHALAGMLMLIACVRLMLLYILCSTRHLFPRTFFSKVGISYSKLARTHSLKVAT